MISVQSIILQMRQIMASLTQCALTLPRAERLSGKNEWAWSNLGENWLYWLCYLAHCQFLPRKLQLRIVGFLQGKTGLSLKKGYKNCGETS